MATGRGGPRPNSGRKPGSTNKLTRKVKATLADLAGKHTEAALNVLIEIMQDKEQTGAARVSAANSVLDRAHGKPIQATVEVKQENLPEPFTGWAIGRVEPD